MSSNVACNSAKRSVFRLRSYTYAGIRISLIRCAPTHFPAVKAPLQCPQILFRDVDVPLFIFVSFFFLFFLHLYPCRSHFHVHDLLRLSTGTGTAGVPTARIRITSCFLYCPWMRVVPTPFDTKTSSNATMCHASDATFTPVIRTKRGRNVCFTNHRCTIT